MRFSNIILLLVALSLASCNIDDDILPRTEDRISSHFVSEYVSVIELSIGVIGRGKDTISVGFIAPPGAGISFLSSGRDLEIYDSLARKHNDTAYNGNVAFVYTYDRRKRISISDTICQNRATLADVSSINVRCDAAWDYNHPAGSSLNDIIRFSCYSLYPYICSGYSSVVPKKSPVVKPLNEMTPEDYYLAINYTNRFNFHLILDHGPEIPSDSGRRTIFVDVEMDNGDVLSDQEVVGF